MNKLAIITLFLLVGCATASSLTFTDAVNIPAGDGAGTTFSGTFATVQKITGNDCDAADLNTPPKDQSYPFDMEIAQDAGAIAFDKVDVKVAGGVSFRADFSAGGADIVDRGAGKANILRIVKITGTFTGKDTFTGDGEERLIGQLSNKVIDCHFTFTLDGNRR